MAPATSATRIFGLLAALLALAGAQDSITTTGGAPDAGTTSSLTDCGGTNAPTGPLGPGDTPAPTRSFRCLPTSLLTSYSDTPSPTAVATAAGGGATAGPSATMDTPSPSEAAATPEPTVVGDSTGMMPAEPTKAATLMPTEAGADGNRDVTITPAPTMEVGEDEGVDADADAVPTTPAPTNADGQTAEEAAAEEGDSTDRAWGLAAPSASGAAMVASCGLLLAAGILAL